MQRVRPRFPSKVYYCSWNVRCIADGMQDRAQDVNRLTDSFICIASHRDRRELKVARDSFRKVFQLTYL